MDGAELRLLMLRGADQRNSSQQVYRWVRHNGHPGHCTEDCWHASPEAALVCFQGGRNG